ncbi:MAG: hypothetical protein AAGI14_11465 [Pseudomonadota bacterium]
MVERAKPQLDDRGRKIVPTVGVYYRRGFVGTHEQYKVYKEEQRQRQLRFCREMEQRGEVCQMPVIRLELPSSIDAADILEERGPGEKVCGSQETVFNGREYFIGPFDRDIFFRKSSTREEWNDIFGPNWFTLEYHEPILGMYVDPANPNRVCEDEIYERTSKEIGVTLRNRSEFCRSQPEQQPNQILDRRALP